MNNTTSQPRFTEIETIAPAKDVAQRKEEFKRKMEEKERLKQEAIERKQKQLEEGLEDDAT